MLQNRPLSLALKLSLALFLILTLVVLYLDWQLVIASWVKYALLIVNIAAYAGYWWDKRAAENDEFRTQESTLLLYSLAGGWPAALIAQHALPHKNRKVSFQIVFYMTVLFNASFLYSLWHNGWL